MKLIMVPVRAPCARAFKLLLVEKAARKASIYISGKQFVNHCDVPRAESRRLKICFKHCNYLI